MREIEINPNTAFQTVKDVAGGNFIHYFGGVEDALDPVSRFNLDNLHPRYFRVSMMLDEWEPVNDNDDPRAFAWEAVKEIEYISGAMRFLQTVQTRPGTGALIASTWDLPDWMVTNPESDQARTLDPALYPEVVESFAAWLLRARDTYGVTVDYVSFNEATLGINILLTPDDYVAFIAVAGPRFEELGLSTKWLLGDCHNIASCAPYVQAIYAHEEIRPYLGPLAFHSWDAGVSDQALIDIADFAEANGLEVWCTEGGWNPQLWQTPNQFPTWHNARSLATIYSRALRLTRATVFQYWEMMGHDYNLNDGSEGYAAFQMLRQYADQFPERTTIVETTRDRSGVYTVAGQAPEHFVVQVINNNMFELQATLTGLPAGTYTHIRSNADEVGAVIGTHEVQGGGALELELLRNSVNVLTTRKP